MLRSAFRIRRRAFAGVALALAGIFGSPAAAQLRDLAPSLQPAAATSPEFVRLPEGGVRFEMVLTEPLEHQLISLSDPDRLVLDLPQLHWRFADKSPNFKAAAGVERLRFSQFRPGRSRLVLDLSGAPTVLRHGVERRAADGSAVFVIEFAVAGATRILEQPEPRAASLALPMRDAASANGPAPHRAPRPRLRPSVMIIALDPGHGGRDPGASYGGLREKDLMLEMARRVRGALEQPGVFHVVLTRDHDEFVPLEERVARAREAGAHLFVSMHADALPEHPEVSGVSIYTLSENSSDSLSARLARRENAVDAIAGVEMAGQSDQVRRILVDFARRRAMGESARIAEMLVRSFRARVQVLSGNPLRQAGFRVLKTFDTPSVLIEFGFLTNIRDRRRLMAEAWRVEATMALVAAIREWAASNPFQASVAVAQQ